MHSKNRSSVALWVIWLGIVLQMAGGVWDQRWHAANPDALETGSELLEAHIGIFVGITVLVAGGVVGVVWSRGAGALVRAWFAVVLLGALLEATGSVWDSWQHTQGAESTLGHLITYLGALGALAGAIMATWAARKMSRTHAEWHQPGR